MTHDLIFVVHGSNAHTWWRRMANGGYAWWKPWSLFCYSLRQAFGGNCQIRDYKWSGSNTNASRVEAGANLAAAIDDQSRERRVHIVGHSHGGNVALIASNHLQAGTVSTIILLANPNIALLKKDGSRSWLYWGKAPERVGCIWNLYSPEDNIQTTGVRLFHGVPSIPRSLVSVSRTYDGPDSQKVRNGAVHWKGTLDAHRAMHSSPVGTVVGRLLRNEPFKDAMLAANLALEDRNEIRDRGGYGGVARSQEMIRSLGDPRPFDLAPRRDHKDGIGVLLVHGFTASPSEMRPLADFIWERTGWPCKAIQLPGHGTNIEDLEKTRATDWLEAVETAYSELTARYRHVFLAGLSLGAVLCCHVGLRRRDDPRLAGLILLAPAFGVSLKRTIGVRMLAPIGHRRSKGPRAVHYFLDRRLFSYVETPLNRAAEVISMGGQAIRNLDKLKGIPILMFSGDLDSTVSLDLIRTAATRNPWIRFIRLPRSRHILTMEPDSNVVFEACLEFMNESMSPPDTGGDVADSQQADGGGGGQE